MGSPGPGATVKLYANDDDYRKQKNLVLSKTTDANGDATFTSLSAIKYYWHVESGCNTNEMTTSTSSFAITSGITNKETVLLKSMGILRFTNTSSNPYFLHINGTLQSTAIQGKTTFDLRAPTGNIPIRVVEKSGYLSTPTDQTFTGSISCGLTSTVTFSS